MKSSMKLFLVLITLSFYSCNQSDDTILNIDTYTKGSVIMKMSTSTIPSEVKVIMIKLERQGFSPIIDSVMITPIVDTVILTINNIPIGNWNLLVVAKDSSSVIRYSGSASITIYENIVSNVYISMFPIGSGIGDLKIYISWPAVKWKMSSLNPVIKQTVGNFDENHIFLLSPSVLKIGSEYKMWYTSGTNSFQATAFATSTNGVNWTKYGIIQSAGSPGSWMEAGIVSPTIIFENGLYKIWFEGKSLNNIHNGIGYATSTDGRSWNFHPTPVISSTLEKPLVFHPTIVKKDGMYYLFYSVEMTNGYNPKIYLATSMDGLNFQDRGIVLQGRPNVDWEKGGVFGCSVMYDDGKFILYYTAKSNLNKFDIGTIGKAESIDGINWTRSSINPELSFSETYPWRTKSVGFPFVMHDGSKLKLWFSAIDIFNSSWQIGYAEQ